MLINTGKSAGKVTFLLICQREFGKISNDGIRAEKSDWQVKFEMPNTPLQSRSIPRIFYWRPMGEAKNWTVCNSSEEST